MLLTVEGLHVPVTPLLDVVGNAGAVAPLQILAGMLNVGVVLGVTVTFTVAGKAHWPAVGVKVYTPLAVLLTVAGLHVPVTPLLDVVGSVGAVAPLQIVVIMLNDGTVFGVTVTLTVTGKAHKPAVGVNI